MKQLNNFILEKLKINSKSKINHYNYKPKDKWELRELVDKLINERGKNADLNDIDTSRITDMSYLFNGDPFHIGNIDISNWNVSNVENMNNMFAGSDFNQDISKWNVSNVEDMFCMFYGCENFNQNLEKWNINKNADIQFMFGGCNNLKKKPSWYKTY